MTKAQQRRVTATFKQREKNLDQRTATVAKPKLAKLYATFNIAATPGGLQKLIKE